MWAEAQGGSSWLDQILKIWPIAMALAGGAFWVIREKSQERTRAKVSDREQIAITNSVSKLEVVCAELLKQQTSQQEHNKSFAVKMEEMCLRAKDTESRLISEIRDIRGEINRNTGSIENLRGRMAGSEKRERGD